ncbi:RAD52 motif-containing protein 1 [Eucyclogobius newberryi]|uniref:RAD52 motif-containing protein 1 n=1 Tax=Eucyclogobius newberryi TaxID=166745 RepID=UPI003B5C40E9
MEAEAVGAEVVEFVVPVENNKTLFVWNLEATRPEHVLLVKLSALFSSFGPLYLLKLSLAAPGFFSALVKFYSSLHAARAQRNTDGKALLQDRPLKVRLSSKKTPHFLSHSKPLSHAHCLNLANHCLGFNGWTSNIISLKKLEPDQDQDQDSQGPSLRLGCLLQLNFPSYHLTTRGAAVLQGTLPCSDPEEMLRTRGRLQRAVREKALVQAFSNVLLVLLGNSKVLLELKDPQMFDFEEQESVLQVTELSLPPEEDEEFEFTVS